MKNILLFNYNIDIDDIKQINTNLYSFYIDYYNYYFLKVSRTIEEINEIYNFLSNTINDYHYIIKNNQNKSFTQIDKENYILLKLRGSENEELNLNDITSNFIEFTGNAKTILNRAKWTDLWEKKVDYLEYQISEMGKDYKLILKSFSYYIGLAENAIQYLNMTNLTNEKLYISHSRLTVPNYNINYNNPLNIVVDSKVRDIAEYIKFAFFEDYGIQKEVEIMVNKNILSEREYNLLFARLLYPTYYFDQIDKIINTNDNEEKLLKYIEKINDFESFINKIFKLFQTRAKLIKIDWLIKL